MTGAAPVCPKVHQQRGLMGCSYHGLLKIFQIGFKNMGVSHGISSKMRRRCYHNGQQALFLAAQVSSIAPDFIFEALPSTCMKRFVSQLANLRSPCGKPNMWPPH